MPQEVFSIKPVIVEPAVSAFIKHYDSGAVLMTKLQAPRIEMDVRSSVNQALSDGYGRGSFRDPTRSGFIFSS